MATNKIKTRRRRAVITAIPLILVNAVAFAGQFGYINAHIPWGVFGAVIFAIALESVALFLAYMANQALMSEDSALGLRLASYLFAAIIGFMNYSHYALPGMVPTFEAVATGLMSLASPWLWGIYSRRQSRDLLRATNQLSPRAVKLGFLRWVLWPKQSFFVFRRAAWSGLNDIDEALTLWVDPEPEPELIEVPAVKEGSKESFLLTTARVPVERSEKAIEPPVTLAALADAHTKADAVRFALNELGQSVGSGVVAEWLQARGWDVTPSSVRTVKARMRPSDELSAR